MSHISSVLLDQFNRRIETDTIPSERKFSIVLLLLKKGKKLLILISIKHFSSF